jgi:ABC-type cobalamin/Fe3+-siderophores transport system ATPase subunit
MLIVVIGPFERPTYPGEHPSIVLNDDSWDDYGFRTTFHATLFLSETQELSLGRVKVLKFGLEEGGTPLPQRCDGLSADFASLGANIEYYEALASTSVGEEVLAAMRDLATNDEIHDRAKNEPAFEASLLRMAPARNALNAIRASRTLPFPEEEASAPTGDQTGDEEEAAVAELPDDSPPMQAVAEEIVEYLQTRPATVTERLELVAAARKAEASAAPAEQAALEFRYTPAASSTFLPASIEFSFAGPEPLPGRLVALVGPNGTGKTTLLSNLALAAFEVGGRDREARQLEVGAVEFGAGVIDQVVFVSYSAYDSFEMPASAPSAGVDPARHLAEEGYVYVGLREISAATSEDRKSRPLTLKSIEKIENEFTEILSALRGDRLDAFVEQVRTIFDEPSVEKIHPLPAGGDDAAVVSHLRAAFPHLSTGHKAIINVVASLSRYLKPDTLVLLDEPEAHLHPPLIAVLLSVTRKLLKRFKAFAIVATHSPVVVQETLGQHVIVLSRADDITGWSVAEFETYGENIATITRNVFGLSPGRADFVAELEALVRKGMSREEIEALFPRKMSSSARAQVIRAGSRVAGGDVS